MFELMIVPGKLTLSELRHISRRHVKLSLDPAAVADIHASTEVVNGVIAEDRTVYGINTGFGLLANTRIAAEDLEELQRSIVLSHAAGIGKLMDDATVKMIMALKVNSLARGFSGIRLLVIEALLTLINKEVYPCIPQKGSVGASGDLAPLAHMSAVLLGEGKARYKGEILCGQAALAMAGLSPSGARSAEMADSSTCPGAYTSTRPETFTSPTGATTASRNLIPKGRSWRYSAPPARATGSSPGPRGWHWTRTATSTAPMSTTAAYPSSTRRRRSPFPKASRARRQTFL